MNINSLNKQMQDIQQGAFEEYNPFKETMTLQYVQQKNIEGEDVEVYILHCSSSRPASFYRDSKELSIEEVYNHVSIPMSLELLMADKALQFALDNYFSSNDKMFTHIPQTLKTEFSKLVKKFLEGQVIKERTGNDDKLVSARRLFKECIKKLEEANLFIKGDGLKVVETPAVEKDAKSPELEKVLAEAQKRLEKIQKLQAKLEAQVSEAEGQTPADETPAEDNATAGKTGKDGK